MQKVFLFLAEGFEETEAITPLDVLRRAGVAIKTVSITQDKNVTGAHGITLLADLSYQEAELDDAAMLILPGGMPGTTNLQKFAPLNELLEKQYEKGGYIAAICAAPLIPGRLNLLQNRNATCYPGFEKELAGAILSEDRVVRDGNIVTSKGPGTALEFGLTLAAILTSKEKAEEIASAMIAK